MSWTTSQGEKQSALVHCFTAYGFMLYLTRPKILQTGLVWEFPLVGASMRFRQRAMMKQHDW